VRFSWLMTLQLEMWMLISSLCAYMVVILISIYLGLSIGLAFALGLLRHGNLRAIKLWSEHFKLNLQQFLCCIYCIVNCGWLLCVSLLGHSPPLMDFLIFHFYRPYSFVEGHNLLTICIVLCRLSVIRYHVLLFI
jgi:hypothetical protein